MERLWENAERSALIAKQRGDAQALDYSVCSGRTVIVSSNSSSNSSSLNGDSPSHGLAPPMSNGRGPPTTNGGGIIHHAPDGGRMEVDEEDDTPMICMICEDKATGLHYGIITCEGYDNPSDPTAIHPQDHLANFNCFPDADAKDFSSGRCRTRGSTLAWRKVIAKLPRLSGIGANTADSKSVSVRAWSLLPSGRIECLADVIPAPSTTCTR